jgi:hypothetical protein
MLFSIRRRVVSLTTASRRNGFCPCRNQFWPCRNGFCPCRNQFWPCRNGFCPCRNGVWPRRNGFCPCRNGVWPRRNGFCPCRNDVWPRRNGVLPYINQLLSPKSDFWSQGSRFCMRKHDIFFHKHQMGTCTNHFR